MRMVLFMAIVANSADLLATTFGIHYFKNGEGNPLLADLAHHHWPIFVMVKGYSSTTSTFDIVGKN